MRTRPVVLAALALAAAAAGCGDERAPLQTPEANSSRVALTVAYPGLAPWALITYRSSHGRACHAFGTLTTAGPRVLGAADEPLDEALAGAGHCLAGDAVSLAVTEGAGGDVRVVGGIAAPGVRRLVVGGERVTPSRSGAFLVAQPSSPALGGVEVVYAGGGRERLPLDDARRPAGRE